MNDTPDLAVSIGINQAALAKSIAQMEKRITDAAKSVEKKAQFKLGGKSAEESARTLGQEMDALRAKFDPLFAKSKRYEAELAEVTRAQKVGAISAKTYEAALERLNAEFAGLGDASGGASGSARSFGSMAQQIGYQVGDFAVQVGAGTSAAQAFGQQAPQLLGAFGMWGAIAGAAVAIGAPLARSFLSIKEEAEPLSDVMDKLGAATSAYAAAADEASRPVADLRKEYGDMADAVERELKTREKMAALRSNNALADAKSALIGGIDASLGSYSIAVELGTTIGKAEEVEAALKAMSEAADFSQAQAASEQLRSALTKVAGDEAEMVRRFGGEDGVMTAVESYMAAMREHVKAAGSELKTFATMAADAASAVAQVEARGFGSLGTFGTGMDAAKGIIKQKEGFSASAYWDVNHYRAGYGSDTGTRADGSTYSVQKGMTVSLDDAERDLERRIAEYFQAIIATIGPEAFQRLTEAQQGALASVIHNYGAGEFKAGGDLGGVVAALKAGENQGVADAIARRGSDNGGINRARRESEASAFGGASEAASSYLNGAAEAAERAASARERMAQAQTSFSESLKKSVGDAEFEASIATKSAAEQAKLRAEYLLTQEAKRQGIDLSAQMAGSELTYADAIRAKAEADAHAAVVADQRKAAEQQVAAQVQASADAHQRLREGIMDTIFAGNSFSTTLSNLALMLAKAKMEAALFGSITTGSNGSKTSTGGLLSGLVNLGSSIFGGFFADGGDPPLGKVSVVGEQGPELFVPKSAGTIIPNKVAFGGGGSSGGLQVTGGQLTLTDDGTIAARIAYQSRAAGAAAFGASQRSFGGNAKTLQSRGTI